MNYAELKTCDIANGQGVRTSLFVSGCTHACPGCFNQSAWDFKAGEPFDEAVQERVLASLEPPYVAGLTVLGGEPMEPSNQRALAPFLRQVKERYPEKDIWVYTGDTYEELIDPQSPRHTEVTDELLCMIDVLVDGLFVQELADITLRFKGSKNQRLIDVKRTRDFQDMQLWCDDPIYKRGRID